MADERYWLSIPGSKDPPQGPMDMGAIRSSWTAGTLDPASTMCKVGDSTWLRVESVLGARLAAIPASAASSPASDGVAVPVEVTGVEVREDLVVRRAALTTGAKALEVNSKIFQILALVMLVAGVLVMNVSQDGLEFPKWQVVMGVVAAAAPFAYATGLILGAFGEVLLALRDGLER